VSPKSTCCYKEAQRSLRADWLRVRLLHQRGPARPMRSEPEVDTLLQGSMKKGKLAKGKVITSKRAYKANENVVGITACITMHLVI